MMKYLPKPNIGNYKYIYENSERYVMEQWGKKTNIQVELRLPSKKEE